MWEILLPMLLSLLCWRECFLVEEEQLPLQWPVEWQDVGVRAAVDVWTIFCSSLCCTMIVGLGNDQWRDRPCWPPQAQLHADGWVTESAARTLTPESVESDESRLPCKINLTKKIQLNNQVIHRISHDRLLIFWLTNYRLQTVMIDYIRFSYMIDY